MDTSTERIQADIEARLADAEPDVELLACERIAAERLRLTIDHPEGVTLALCERVTKHLTDLLVDYGLEVSSPGPQRPLTKPDHFRRFIGRRAKVRVREARSADRSPSGRAPQRTFTGELVGASDEEVTVAAENGVVSIPYSEIGKSNLVESQTGGGEE